VHAPAFAGGAGTGPGGIGDASDPTHTDQSQLGELFQNGILLYGGDRESRPVPSSGGVAAPSYPAAGTFLAWKTRGNCRTFLARQKHGRGVSAIRLLLNHFGGIVHASTVRGNYRGWGNDRLGADGPGLWYSVPGGSGTALGRDHVRRRPLWGPVHDVINGPIDPGDVDRAGHRF